MQISVNPTTGLGGTHQGTVGRDRFGDLGIVTQLPGQFVVREVAINCTPERVQILVL